MESKKSLRAIRLLTNARGPRRIKIAYIGGGSVGWAHILMKDLAGQKVLCGEVALYDTDFPAARANAAYGNLIQASPAVLSSWTYRAVRSPGQALKDADFVIMSIQPGTFDEMEAEIRIAGKYGLIYPVGDTVGAPGYVRALRTVPIYAEYARMIKAVCPKAWVVNYTNPMTVCTRTLTKVEPSLKVFGCCHEVFGTQSLLGRLVAETFGVPQPGREEIKVNVMGVNHFTWINRASWKGHDLLPLLKKQVKKKMPLGRLARRSVMAKKSMFTSESHIAFELFNRYGVLAAAGDRHLAEFVPGFLLSNNDLFRWGIRRTPVPWRRRKQARIRRAHALEVKRGRPPKIESSGEEGVFQLMALKGLAAFTTNVNVENRGQIPNLPRRAVVETNARFSGNGIDPVGAGPVPDNLLGLMTTHVMNQEMIVEAALEKDMDKAFMAVFNDPTVTIPIDKAYKMFGEMLRATRRFLPGWKNI